VHARVVHAFAQPGHWLGPVTGLGWLGLAQPQKKIKKKKMCMHIFKFTFIGLFKELESATPFIFVLGYVIFINARVGIIRARIFTGARVRNMVNKSS
jgi:hypothetical protein